MQRHTLIMELPSVSEAGFPTAPQAGQPQRAVPHRHVISRGLLVGALLLACGCQSNGSLAKLFKKPKLANEESVLSVLDENQKAGLPKSSQSTDDRDTLNRLLDHGQESLSKFYKDADPSHLKEAHRSYEQALAKSPGNSESHHGLAIVCDLQKDYQSAELHYRAALESDPGNGKILGDLGYSYLLQGKYPDSEITLVKATKIDPNNTQAMKNLGLVYARQGDYNLADSTFHRVMNDVEARQEMAKLFPRGRPDMARNGEIAKLPWMGKDKLTAEQFEDRMESARALSVAEMKRNRSLLEEHSVAGLTNEQLQAKVAQLEQEKFDAERTLATRQEQANNTPLVLGDAPSRYEGQNPGIQITPQMGQRAASPYPNQGPGPGQLYAGGSPAQSAPRQSQPISRQGRRANNSFYPDDPATAPGQNRNGIDRVSGNDAQWGPNGRAPNESAYYQTNRGIDPRTGRPINPGIQQTEGQEPLLIPNGNGNAYGDPTEGSSSPNNSASQRGNTGVSEEAKRRAAMYGMGGPELMFNVPAISAPTVNGGNRLAPGTGSAWNGSGYPPVQRMLPMDAAPHDLNKLMQAPTGQMTVQPGEMGMYNPATGRSFSNPNVEQRLQPQINLESPMGNQGMNLPEQTDSSQWPAAGQGQSQPRGQQQPTEYGDAPSDSAGQSQSGNASRQSRNTLNNDPRQGINSDLNQYGQMQEYRPSSPYQTGWSQTQTPSSGLANQPVVPRQNQILSQGWNQQQLTPRFDPPPYPGRPTEGNDDQGSAPLGSGNAPAEYGSSNGNFDSTRSSEAAASYAPEPTAIYSPGIRVPPSYGSGTRATNSYNQSFDGPRIVPGSR